MRIITITQQCRVCKEFKGYKFFTKSKRYKSGYDTICKMCNRKHVADWKKIQNLNKERKRHNSVSAKWVENLKFEVLNHYGPCYCCGEQILAFLTIDHIKGNGRQHRKEINMIGYRFYVWLRNNNYPEEYRTACANCNMATRFGKTCPHKVT